MDTWKCNSQWLDSDYCVDLSEDINLCTVKTNGDEEDSDSEDDDLPELIPRDTTEDEEDSFLADMTWHQLTGKDQTFNSLAYVMHSLDKVHNYERLQPKLAWKPLEVIKRTLEATTQWGRQVIKFPLQKHHVSRFPWANRTRL